MKLRQLQAFKIVFEEGSITLAADRFGITQPSMSALIGNLENEIGFTLFNRQKGRLRATSEAAQFYNEVVQVLNGFDKIARTTRNIRDLTYGELRIAANPAVSVGFMSRVIASFSREHPQVNVSLQTQTSPQVHDWLDAQLFDIGISALPVSNPTIKAEPLIVNCVCAVPSDHPLAALEVITPSDVAPYPFISLNPDHKTHIRLKKIFDAEDIPWKPRFECTLFAPACALVAAGVGVAVIDPFTAEDFKDRRIEFRPFKPTITYDVCLLRPVFRPSSLIADEFERLLKKELLELGLAGC